MRTITAVALALSMLFTVAAANATTHKKHRRHSSKSSQQQKDASKDTAKAATKEKPAK